MQRFVFIIRAKKKKIAQRKTSKAAKFLQFQEKTFSMGKEYRKKKKKSLKSESQNESLLTFFIAEATQMCPMEVYPKQRKKAQRVGSRLH